MLSSDVYYDECSVILADKKRYTSCYCEENVYRLVAALPPPHERLSCAVFISNTARSCALWQQRSTASWNSPVFWDYHVIGVSGSPPAALVWDLDSTLPWPCPLATYISATFGPGTIQARDTGPIDLRLTSHYPRFRVVAAVDFVNRFSSDRRHMRDSNGRWLAPPPSSPALRGSLAASDHELPRYWTMDAGDNDPAWLGRLADITDLDAVIDALTRE